MLFHPYDIHLEGKKTLELCSNILSSALIHNSLLTIVSIKYSFLKQIETAKVELITGNFSTRLSSWHLV